MTGAEGVGRLPHQLREVRVLPPQRRLALAALAVLVVVGAVSARAARRRMAYETWHLGHLYTYAAVVLAFTHQIAVGTSFTSSPAATAHWYGVWGAALGALLAGRVVLPLRRNLRHRLRATAVVPENDHVVSILITGRDLDRLPARAGQFFPWRFLTRDHWWQANPSSLSMGCGTPRTPAGCAPSWRSPTGRSRPPRDRSAVTTSSTGAPGVRRPDRSP